MIYLRKLTVQFLIDTTPVENAGTYVLPDQLSLLLLTINGIYDRLLILDRILDRLRRQYGSLHIELPRYDGVMANDITREMDNVKNDIININSGRLKLTSLLRKMESVYKEYKPYYTRKPKLN
jgi:hypothetical protein